MNCAIHRAALRILSILCLLVVTASAYSQQFDSSITTLSSVEVKAYGQVRRLKDVPAAVGYVNTEMLNRFSPASVVQAVNTVPGVRMEERSPGSYRLNIRGSSLRSPFGVRNIKVYYNDLPYTDPGGTTYLNGLGTSNIGSIEILKGPGSSLYGAGTGGVLLIESMPANEEANLTAAYTVGSYGLRNATLSATTGTAINESKISFQHQQSDGYREHSALERTVFSWTGRFHLNDQQLLKTTVLYSDLFYETPGALTLAEYKVDPTRSRPGGGGFPGSVQSKAAIKQKTVLAGVSFQQRFSESISNQTAAYGMFTDFQNPAIRNYGKSTEPHAGGRTVFTYKKDLGATRLNLSAGGELQQNFTTSTVFKNAGGNPDSLQTQDEIHIRQSFVFLQANLAWNTWELTAGASLNGSELRFRRAYPTPLPEQKQTLNNQLTPRIALSKNFQNAVVYTSVSKGFSPPTSAELLPSGSSINLDLQPEEGLNYDVGMRVTFATNLTVDINAFYFRLKNTIVQRRDAGGGDFFINAGKTTQKGVETSLRYSFLHHNDVFSTGTAWLSHTYHHFRYQSFKQLATDFSGNALPGVAPSTVSAGVYLPAKNGLSATLTYFFSSRIPLNDANTAYAGAYHLLGAQIGFTKNLKKRTQATIVVGADNLLDQQYSLGNDVNGFGGRYYNAAAGRNFYATLQLQFLPKK